VAAQCQRRLRQVLIGPQALACFAALPQRSTNLRRFKPQSKATVDLMRTIAVVFVLALIAVAFEVYSDWAMMSGSVTAPVDPVSRAAADSTH
jgi:predicted acyltransferase